MSNLEDAPRSRRVSYGQLEALFEFLNSHREVALGFNKSAQARDHSRKMWQRVAQQLNSMGEGAVKNWKGWSSYWVDFKAKLKRKVSSIRIARRRTGGGPSSVPSLTDVESRFLRIMGEDFGSGLPGVRVDPFENVMLFVVMATEQQSVHSESAVLSQHQLEGPTTSTLSSSDTPVLIVVAPDEQPLQSVLDSVSILDPQPRDVEMVTGRGFGDDDAGEGCSSVEIRAGRSTVEGQGGGSAAEPRAGRSTVEGQGGGSAAEPRAGGSAVEGQGGGLAAEPRAGGSMVEGRGGGSAVEPRAGGSTTGRIPAVRRRRRRVLTAEAARQILIDSSERRAEIERTNSQLLARLVDVLEEIRETLRQTRTSVDRGADAAPTNAEPDPDA